MGFVVVKRNPPPGALTSSDHLHRLGKLMDIGRGAKRRTDERRISHERTDRTKP